MLICSCSAQTEMPARPQAPATAAPAVLPGDSPAANAERLAMRMERLTLNVHLNTDTGAVVTRAQVRVRNGGTAPLGRLALQVSSALEWQSATLVESNGIRTTLPVQQYRVTTDTDHTGAANELVLALQKALPAGAEVNLDLFYGGTLGQSAERLQRLGAPAERAAQADWDGVSGTFTGLRGFGNVLWYPVAAPAALLADGDRFAQAVTAERERTSGTLMELSLTVEHTGPPARTAWFLDRPAALESPLRRRSPMTAEAGEKPTGGAAQPAPAPVLAPPDGPAGQAGSSPAGSTDAQAVEADQSVIETVQWEPMPLGERPASLFLARGSDAPAASAGAGGALVNVVGGDAAAQQSYADAAAKVEPVLKQWLPVRGTTPLTVLALPAPGLQAFADGDLLVTPMRVDDTAALAEALVYPLAAARLPAGAPAWVRQGVPEFLRLQYMERTGGRERMLAELGAEAPALQQMEAERGMDPAPLRTCVDPVCARSKAAYVLTMLRSVAGDAALEQALQAMLVSGADSPEQRDDGRGMTRRFEAALTQSSGKDLGWFFADWFSADRGLPDLQIVQVAPRRVERGSASVVTPSSKRPVAGPIGAEPEAEADDPRRNSTTTASRNTAGLPDGSWLVAVEVQNNGDAAAEVPVTVRTASLQNQLPLRIPGHGRATIRVPFETTPEQVWVNDGTTPEQHGTTHRRTIEITHQP